MDEDEEEEGSREIAAVAEETHFGVYAFGGEKWGFLGFFDTSASLNGDVD